MTHLDQFPKLNQRNERTIDGHYDENAGLNCVPTSIAAALWWLTGHVFYGDQVKDAVEDVLHHHPDYTGPTKIDDFVAYCAMFGVALSPVRGSPTELVATIHREVEHNQPVLVTVPVFWSHPELTGQNPGGITHVMVACGQNPGEIEVMDPWKGDFWKKSDDWFELMLCYGKVWPMEAISMIPKGPFVQYTFGVEIPETVGWKQLPAQYGISARDLLSISGNEYLAPYDGNPASVRGLKIHLPGYPQPAAQPPEK